VKQRAADAGRTVAYRRNATLYRQGDTQDCLYFLRSGSGKSIITTADGCEQIVSFHFPGDLLGFDGITSGRHQSTSVTLETAGVCRIPLSKLKNKSTQDVNLWDDLIRAVAAEIAEKQTYGVLLAHKSVRARFATFLCSLSTKYASRGCAEHEFNLSMSRQDIANYLSMAVETLSRLLTEFQRKQLIDVDRRFVRIKDVRGLKAIACERSVVDRSYA
jgi:CRP/FNR family transcriptional regulator